MKALVAAAGAVLLTMSTAPMAQESMLGTWNASYTSTGIESRLQSLSIKIESIEDGRVKATGIRHDRGCAGEYPLEGSLKGDTLRVRATKKGGPSGDCSFGFIGKVEGDKILAKWGNYDVEFRK